jgi:hypothetical protein
MCAIQPQQGAQNWKRVEIPMVNFERQFFISIDRLRSPTLINLLLSVYWVWAVPERTRRSIL